MTDTTDTADTPTIATDLIDVYFEMWRATDPEGRAQLVARAFTDEGRHVDPAADVVGHDQLAAMLGSVHATYPGFAIERISGHDQHGVHARFAWRLTTADGSPLLAGLDVAEVGDDGRFAHIVSFWGDLPAR